MMKMNQRNKIAKVSSSILSANFAKLGEEISLISKYSDYIHIDVMDGSFVPNITIGPEVIKSIRPYSNLPFDVHLMTNNVERHIMQFAEAGADMITIHVEACTHLDRKISLIKSLGKKVGVSLVPSTHENVLDYILDSLDLVLVMTVNPGYAGQQFLESQIEKIQSIKRKIDARNLPIELFVDGGINDKTASKVIEAGADVLVAGSYIFKDGPNTYQSKIEQLKLFH